MHLVVPILPSQSLRFPPAINFVPFQRLIGRPGTIPVPPPGTVDRFGEILNVHRDQICRIDGFLGAYECDHWRRGVRWDYFHQPDV